MRLVCWLLCLALPLQAAQTVYRWVDAQGVIHFSDQPQPGTQSETLQVTTQPPGKPQPAAPVQTNQAPLASPSATGEEAYTIELASPKDQETLRDNEGTIPLQARVHPFTPKQGFQIKVLLDGQETSTLTNQLPVSLSNVERGSHQIQLQLLDKDGKVLASSSSITVYLHRASALSPARQAKSGG